MEDSAEQAPDRSLILPSWANNLPSEWSWHALADICLDIVDCPHATPELVDGGAYLMARTPDILSGVFRSDEARHVSESTYRDRIRRAEPRYGDLVYSREGTYFGLAAEIPSETKVCLGQRMVLLRPDPERVHPTYLRYWLNSSRFQSHVHGHRDGSVAERLNLPTIRRLPVCTPSLRQQRGIAHMLGMMDDKIELNSRMNRTLEDTARAIFKSWFVDFDPVRGTVTLPHDIRRLFPDSLADSTIGPIPEGWAVSPLGEQVEVTRGLSYTGAGLADEGMPLHNLNSVLEGGGYKYDGIKYYTGEFRERDRVRPGDVIVANTEQGFEHLLIGYPAIVPRLFGGGGLYSQDLSRLRPATGSPFMLRYIYLLLVGFRMHHTVAGYSNGTTVNHLAPDGLRKPLVVVPPDALVARFEDIVQPMFDQQEALFAEAQTLADIRDTLLPKLISGEIRVHREPARAD